MTSKTHCRHIQVLRCEVVYLLLDPNRKIYTFITLDHWMSAEGTRITERMKIMVSGQKSVHETS